MTLARIRCSRCIWVVNYVILHTLLLLPAHLIVGGLLHAEPGLLLKSKLLVVVEFLLLLQAVLTVVHICCLREGEDLPLER